MSEAQLAAALRYLFDEHFTAAQKTALQQQAANVSVRLGKYERYTGGAINVIGGEQRTPRFIINASSSTLPLNNGIPNTSSLSIGATPHRVDLLWLQDVADIVTDTQEEIERVMQNLNDYVGPGNTRNAAAWAQAITNHPNRSSLNQRFTTYREVPAEFAQLVPDVGAFRETLSHFFTFTASGEYYERWNGSGRRVPEDLHATYKQHNILELKLRRDEVYIYAVVPTRFLDPNAPAGMTRLREVIWGFRWANAEHTAIHGVRLLHTVAVDQDCGDFFDFVCFTAEDGVGIAIPEQARAAIDPELVSFLDQLPEETAARTAYIRNSPFTTDDDPPLLRMLAVVNGEATFPEGVHSIGLGDARALLAPVERVLEIAELSQVAELRLPRPVFPHLADVRTQVNHAALEARIAAASRGGAGVIVGIIDSGIDANHAAFGNRVINVWDQADPMGPTPFRRAEATGDRLRMFRNLFFNYGTDFEGTTGPAAVANARDSESHGTHVAGIAAGAAITGAHPLSPGMAPNAEIIGVRLGRAQTGLPDPFDPVLKATSDFDAFMAVHYILEKARMHNADAPVVINMSWGSQDHAHDATDILSVMLDGAAREGGNYKPGLALVAACGNSRDDDIHVQRTIAGVPSTTGPTPAAGTMETLHVRLSRPNMKQPFFEAVTLWVENAANGNFAPFFLRARRPGTVASTGFVLQRTDATPVWQTFWGEGAHIGISFGPRNARNNDFNAKVLFQTAGVLIPVPAGTAGAIDVGGTSYVPVRLNRDWTIDVGTGPVSIATIPGAMPLPLGVMGNTWDIEVYNFGAQALDVHAWCARENAQFTGVTAADRSHVIASPAESPGVISVASMNSNVTPPNPLPATVSLGTVGALSPFSSPGPLRKHPTVPGIDITAPGCLTTSARSAHHRTNSATDPLAVNDNALAMAGTSQAAPAITGLIACIFAEEPTLTLTDLRSRFARCSIPSGLPAGTPSATNDWGEGMVDANLLKLP